MKKLKVIGLVQTSISLVLNLITYAVIAIGINKQTSLTTSFVSLLSINLINAFINSILIWRSKNQKMHIFCGLGNLFCFITVFPFFGFFFWYALYTTEEEQQELLGIVKTNDKSKTK